MVFYIGKIPIHLYGVLLMLGTIAGAWLASMEAKRHGEDPEIVWDALTWVLIGGVVGARLWHVFTPPESMVKVGITTHYYLTHPFAMIAIWRGGLGIPGAVMGGALAFWLFVRHYNKRLERLPKKERGNRRPLRFARWADFVAPGLALGQAIGRWGNYVNQELYGAPTDLPWAIHIDPEHRLPEFAHEAYYHPLFFYEFLWNLLNMSVLLYLGRKWRDRLYEGDLFLIYLIIYGVGRFFLEFLRLDPAEVGGLDVNQMLMGVVALASAAALAWRHRHGTPAPATPQGKRRR